MNAARPELTLIATDPEHDDQAETLQTRIVNLQELLTLIEAGSHRNGNIHALLRQCLDDCRQRLRLLESSPGT